MEEGSANKRNTRFTRNKTEDISSLLYGKIPPQARELEEAVLGAILIESDAYSYVSDILKPESFYVDAHNTIFKTIKNLSEKSHPIDLLEVTEELRKEAKLEEVGGAFYLSELTNKVASSANVEYHARIIVQKFIQRELIRVCNDTIRDAYEDTIDVFDLLDDANIKIDTITGAIYSSSVNTVHSEIEKTKKDMLVALELPNSIPSILDIRFDCGTVNALGAKPGTGKTAVMIQAAAKAAAEGYPVGIVSLELNKRMLTAKMLHNATGIFAKKIMRRQLSEFEKEVILKHKYDIYQRVFIDDTRTTNQNIRSKIIALVKKYGCKIIWIDYIQLVTMVKDKGVSDVAAMEQLMNTLQQTAKELDIAIVVLSQMTRGFEKPNLEELRGGGIEQACTQVYILWDEFLKDNQGKKFTEIPENVRGKLWLLDEKERFDGVENRSLYYDKLNQTMCDWNDRPANSYVPPKPNYVPGEDKAETIQYVEIKKEDKNDGENFDIF